MWAKRKVGGAENCWCSSANGTRTSKQDTYTTTAVYGNQSTQQTRDQLMIENTEIHLIKQFSEKRDEKDKI